jgi:hypothetical protein
MKLRIRPPPSRIRNMLTQTAVTILPIGCVVKNDAIALKDPFANQA